MADQVTHRYDQHSEANTFIAEIARTSPTKSLREVAILSPHFPPATLAGVHRARLLAKHLPSHGWKPIIVRAHERHYTELLDPALASLVPESVEQIRTEAVPAALARSLGIGDIGLRGFAAFHAALTDLARRRNLEAVLITGSPFYPMLLARHVRQVLRLPVILDFQDPWVSAEGAQRRRWSKGGLAHRLAVVLEPRALRHATFITGVTEWQNDEVATRYPWLDRSRMEAIPIGGDPDDFVALRAMKTNVFDLDPGLTHLSYVGTFLPRAVGPVRAVLHALRTLRDSSPALAARLRLNFVGTSNQPDGRGAHLVGPLAEACGVADLVIEHPARVPYLEALAILARSQGLLLIGSDEPHYSASKIYPALMSGTPYLALFHRASSAQHVLRAAGGGRSFAFETSDDLASLNGELTNALVDLATRPDIMGIADPFSYAAVTADAVARRFAAIFNGLTRVRQAGM